MILKTHLLLTFVFILLLLAPAFSEELLVAAASDLTFAFVEIGKQFEKDTGNKVVFSFGSTGMLKEQIRFGAPFDVFATADEYYITKLKDENLVKMDSIRIYAKGKLVIATNKKKKQIKDLHGLLSGEIKRIAIANPDHAPYGIAAKAALIKAGLWDKLKGKFIFGENAMQALQFVQTGNAEAGIIPLSIAKVPEINYELVNDRLYLPITQSIAILSKSKKEKSGIKFIDFLCSDKGRAILKKFGYKLP
ncbi:MAG: molybdate ABC transporter substrate-binding protein [Nitrospirae bacterium GWC2_46_6]|nr:MAG: molybdate ABC transporter substrate-binding protein [Nitrospirae bacterium GWC2_46_6]